MGGTALALVLTVASGPASAETKRERQLEKRIENLENMMRGMQEELKRARDEAKQAKEAATKIPEKVTRSGKKGITLTVSGQVNRAVLMASDGEDVNWYNVDNDHSSTRVRFEGRGKISSDFTVGTNFEVEMQTNPSNSVNKFNNEDPGATSFRTRKTEIFFDSKKFGKLTLGHGPTASDGSSEIDLTGTNLVIKSNQGEFAGGQIFIRERNEGTSQKLQSTNPTIGGTFSNFDGLSRQDRLRYDTPKFFGFRAAGSFLNESAMDGAALYVGKHFGVKMAGKIAYAHDPQGSNDRNQLSGSASALHESTGIGLTFASGCRNAFGFSDGPNAQSCTEKSFWYIKPGWQWDIFDFGRTHFAIDYYDSRGIGTRGDRARSIGGGIVQKVDGWSTEIYLGFRNYELQRSPSGNVNSDFQDIFAMLAGARIKF
ncbi:MAG: porin [Alphaproteobacteria bacterium]|nr:porin [Alphaproteobacteria bacterium]